MNTSLLCECGCGQTPTPGKRFVFTHHARTRRGPTLRRAPCECGCGEIANPGKRFIVGHHRRGKRAATKRETQPCQCGCGSTAPPGKRFLYGHYARSLRGSSGRPRSTICPRCGRSVNLREDGTLGLHWVSKGKVGERYRCPAGGVPAPLRRPRPGRRVSVTVDVVLPEGWDVPRFRAAAVQLLRAHLDEPHVFGVDVADSREAS